MDHSESVWGKSFCWFLLITRMCAQSCLTVCNPMDYSPLGSSVHGILQVRRLEWVAISFSRGSSWPRNRRVSPALEGGFLATELSWKPPYRPAFITEPWSPEWHQWAWEAEGQCLGLQLCDPIWLQSVLYCSVLASPAALGLVQEVKSGSHPSKTGVGSENQHRRWCGCLA